MLYADVVLRQFTGGIEDRFTYAVPKNIALRLKIGQLVKVPLRQKKLEGVVVALHHRRPPFPVRPLTSLLGEEIWLTPPGLKLASFLQREYLASLSSALALLVPKRRASPQTPGPIRQKSHQTRISKPKLTSAQKSALKTIRQSKKPILLFGVAGSGKTEIYLRLTEETLKKNQGVIILVPEIALTPQTTARFKERFRGKAAVIHSSLTPKERFQEWTALKEGRKKIAIGPRSALFAPVEKLGLIVVDEEHDTSYKQENTPRYLVRQVAGELSRLTGAKLILGSATPSLESFYQAQRGKYQLVRLPERIFKRPESKIFLVDMTNELRSGNRSSLSSLLQLALEESYERREQGLLFLNRRGSATLITCQDCGKTLLCPHCQLPLIYHAHGQKPHHLRCHHCSFSLPAPLSCPVCRGANLKYLGSGTEKIEKELKTLLPQARLIRLDRDIGRGSELFFEAYRKLLNKEVDFLIGTQMVTKGWDLPGLSLVGIISTDQGMHLPEYLASERTFALISQTLGRAGRREKPGRIIVQTHNPENSLLRLALKQDYENFFKEEIKLRRRFNLPPFTRLIRLLLEMKSKEKANEKLTRVEAQLKKIKLPEVIEISSAPCFLEKLRGKYRYHIIIKTKKISPQLYRFLKGLIPDFSVDVDPVNLL